MIFFFTKVSYFVKQYSVAPHKSDTPNSDTNANVTFILGTVY